MRIEKKSRKKAKENRDFFLEINEVVKISSFLRINSEKMFVDILNPIISKKSMKENWKIKERIYKKRDYF